MLSDPLRIQAQPTDSLCQFTHRGVRHSVWVQGPTDRRVIIASARRHLQLFDESPVSSVLIRTRKEMERWNPPKLDRRAW